MYIGPSTRQKNCMLLFKINAENRTCLLHNSNDEIYIFCVTVNSYILLLIDVIISNTKRKHL